MRSPKIYLTILITLLATVSTSLLLNFRVSFSKAQALDGTPSAQNGEADRLLQQGDSQISAGEQDAALKSWQQALSIYKESHNRQGEEEALARVAMFYQKMFFQTRRDVDKAIEYDQQVLALARELLDRDREVTALDLLITDYVALKKYDQALEYQQQRLALARQIHNYQLEARALENLADFYERHLGDINQAVLYLQQGLALAHSTHDSNAELHFLIELGKSYSHLGDYNQLISSAQRGLTMAREMQDSVSERTALELLGGGYLALGDYGKAIDNYQQMLAITRQQKNRVREWQDLETLGDALLRSQKSVEAEKTLREGIQVWESLRDEEGGVERQGWSIYNHRDRLYRLLQKALIAQNKIDAALEIAEGGRARGFMQLLQEQLSSTPGAQSSIISPTKEILQQIAKQHSATLVEYSIIKDDFNIKGKQETKESELFIWIVQPTGKVAFRQVDLKPLWQQQNTSLPDLVISTRDSIGVRGLGLQEKLPFKPGDLVRRKGDYPDFPPREVVAINIQKGTVTLKFPSDPPDVQPEEIPLTDVVKVVSSAAQNLRLQQLYKLLIEPIAQELPKHPNDRVIFLPQGELFLLPFPALQDVSGKYLIEQHTILTAPAIQVLALTQRARQRVSGKDVLVVGNPTMPKIALNPGEQPFQLPQLPGAQQEAIAIAQLLKTKAITGNQATKAFVVQQMAAAKIVHLATHGLLEDFKGLGEPGAIALAPSGNDDGLLTPFEILNMKLKAELVVLSACNTGQGEISGDGVLGLSRSLIGAGVPSVIVSLWSVPDAPTASLMREFYQQMLNTHDKALALRLAMLKTMQQNPDPKDWAAFTLIGEAE